MCLVKSQREVSTLSNTGALQCLFGECNLWNRTLGISRNLPSSAGWSWPGTCESTTLKVATYINSKMADLSKGMSITNCRARGHPKTILHPRTEPPLFCRVACWRFRWEVDERTLHFSNQRLGRRCVDSMVFGVAWHSKWPKFSTPTKLGMGCIGIFLSAPVIHPRLCQKQSGELWSPKLSSHTRWPAPSTWNGSVVENVWVLHYYLLPDWWSTIIITPNDRDQSQLVHTYQYVYPLNIFQDLKVCIKHEPR